MVNSFKGEVLIEDGGKRYTFVLGMFAQMQLEEMTGETWSNFWRRNEDWSTTDIFKLFKAGLARHHGDMETVEITDLIDRLGQPQVGAFISEAINKASPPKTEQEMPPEPEHREDAKGNAHPPPPTTKKRTAHATTM